MKNLKKEAELFLKKRTIQKDTLCITRNEALSGLSDFAEQQIKLFSMHVVSNSEAALPCEHKYMLMDSDWQKCKHCGNLIPTQGNDC